MKKLSSLIIAGALSTLAPAVAMAYETTASSTSAVETPRNILEAARDSGGFSIFLAAVEQADMTAALSSKRVQYTLYAPTDAAFAKIPQDQLLALFEDKDELRRIVAQHVVLGRYSSADITSGTKRTIWGEVLPVTTHRNLHVNWVKVVATDLASENGVVHAVDNVMLSSGEQASAFSQKLAEFNAASLGQGNRF